MKIGIIIYSKTGNTLSVAKLLKERFIENKYDTTIEVIEVSGNPEAGVGNFKFENLPKISEYDTIIFGSPVNAFSLGKVMQSYLKQLPVFRDKQIACFVTQYFPFPWLGGNNAIRQMKQICEDKRGKIMATGVINWTKKDRQQQTDEVVDYIFNAIAE